MNKDIYYREAEEDDFSCSLCFASCAVVLFSMDSNILLLLHIQTYLLFTLNGTEWI